jgi:hypothetical protein
MLEQFDRWVGEGERQSIPWRLENTKVQLRGDQRLVLPLAIRISGRDLRRHAPQHDLALMLRVAPDRGPWFPGFGWLEKKLDQPLPGHTSLLFTFQLLVKPGRFRFAIVLHDRTSGQRNVLLRHMRVEPLARDPLPHAFRNLPAVEFLRAEEGLDTAWQPGVGRLWLPVETRRPVEIELLVNFGLSEELISRRRSREEDNRTVTLSSLKPFTQLSLSNGRLHVTALDLVRRRILFRQQNLRELDWPGLRAALDELDPNVISAQALEQRKQNAAFFREILEQRLCASAAPGESEPAGSGGAGISAAATRPHRVFIVLSSATLFDMGANLDPVQPPADCQCSVYYVRLHVLGNLWDELHRILRPLNPKRYEIRDPLDLRKALAKILADLNQM